MKTNRRHFLRAATGVASTALVPLLPETAEANIVGTTGNWAAASDATLWGKAWARRFTNVAPNPLASSFIYKPVAGACEYAISAGQTTADILGVPGVTTTVWGYYNQETAPTYPGRTFQVTKGTPITVHWTNRLMSGSGTPLPHILPVDQTIQGSSAIKAISTGVPLAVHHHGGNTAAEFDGGPDQWATPVRRQTGPGISANYPLQTSTPQAITYQYANTEEASMHWYHDHAESITGINAGAGLAGLYVIRDNNEATLQAWKQLPAAGDEIALVLQDRVFNASGALQYTANPADSPQGPDPMANGTPFPAGSPSHMPEMFGDVIVVNGKAWPMMSLQPRKYRLRFLNGSDSRFYTLKFSNSSVPMWVIANDGGFLNAPVKVGAAGLTIAPGERYEVVVDFAQVWWSGGSVDLLNSAPVPFPNGAAPSPGTANIMRFKVPTGLFSWLNLLSQPSCSGFTGYNALRGRNGCSALPAVSALPKPTTTRRILLGEGTDVYGRILPMIGTYDPANASKNLGTLSFQDPATETPKLGTSEIWEIWNTTVDAHPIHVHLVQFRIINRQTFSGTTEATTMSTGATGVRLLPGATLTGSATAPGAWEAGWKDTVVCPPGQVTRVHLTFNRPGKYVYHCHILSHEDHDMMRWYQVV